MIQDIFPHKMHNEFKNKKPEDKDYILLYKDKNVLAKIEKNNIEFPTYRWVKEYILDGNDEIEKEVRYFFSIDEKSYYGIPSVEPIEIQEFCIQSVMDFRDREPLWKIYAGAVGGHLNHWYQNTKYCGRCGEKMHPYIIERAMQCPVCNNIVYPKIAPAVIVAVTDKDRILMTKYAGRAFKKYALIAGYAEVGETLEETVKREVMEEVGLKVKNIHYYKSQPWSFDDTLLSGYFCELDGSDQITLEEEELAMAQWFHRDEMPLMPSRLSLTNEMMQVFRTGDWQEEVLMKNIAENSYFPQQINTNLL